jgi:hypothetical protein
MESVGKKDTVFFGRTDLGFVFVGQEKVWMNNKTANRWLSRASKSEEAKRKKASSRTEFEQQTSNSFGGGHNPREKKKIKLTVTYFVSSVRCPC